MASWRLLAPLLRSSTRRPRPSSRLAGHLINRLVAQYSTSAASISRFPSGAMEETFTGRGSIGVVCRVTGPVVDVRFDLDISSGEDRLPRIYTALEVLDHEFKLLLEVTQHLRRDTVRCMSMKGTNGLEIGQPVFNTGSPLTVPVGRGTLGRIINVMGEPIDGRGHIDTDQFLPIRDEARSPFVEHEETTTNATTPQDHHEIDQQPILVTGIKAIDLLSPLVRGGKIGLFGDGVAGMTRLIMELINNVAKAHGGLSVFAGSRGHTRMYLQMIESGVIKLGRDKQEVDQSSKCALVYSERYDPHGARARVGLAGLTLAENFCDAGHDVLLFIDKIFHSTQIGAQLGSRSRTTRRSKKAGSITCVDVTYKLDDLFTHGAHFDAVTVLSSSREISRLGGICPAVDPFDSTSCILDREIVGNEHYDTACRVQEILEDYRCLRFRTLPNVLDYLTEDQRRYFKRARKIQTFLSQPLYVAEAQTGSPGKYVELKDTIKSFREILDGKYDHLPEEAFSMVGGIDDVIA